MSYLTANIDLRRGTFHMSLKCSFDAAITGIFGSSGAGKTTLLNIIAGLTEMNSGQIEMNHQLLYDKAKKINIPPEQRRIGYVFQEGRLFPHLSVKENLRFGEKLLNSGQRKVIFKEVIDLLEIGPLLNKKIKEISGGQAQRVAIGRALLTSPKLLLFDEPFAGLDARLRSQVIPFLKRITSHYQIPMLIVSHDLQDLLKITDQLMLMQDGKCLGQGEFTKLLDENKAFNLLSYSGMVNTAEMHVQTSLPESGMVILKAGDDQLLRAELNTEKEPLKPGEKVNISMRPEDVTLALHHIEDISIQNQIKGTVGQVINKHNKAICLVDAGFPVIAEVTVATAKNMHIVPGKEIWCLIKAAAIKVDRAE